MITLKQLAKELEVSVSTVSKALSDSHEISKETKEKIQLLAKKHNYIPNNTAVNLRKRQTKTIGVVIPNIFNHFYTKILYGIESEAKKLGYKTIVCISNENLDSEKESIDYFSNGSVDGILMAPSTETEKLGETNHISELQDKKIPLVFFDRYINTIDCSKVVIDDFNAAREAIHYLVGKGRKKIAVVSSLEGLHIGVLRRDGAKSALDEHQITDANAKFVSVAVSKEIEARVTTLLSDKTAVDAILALDELSGIISLNVARKLGYSLPKELSLISFSQGILSKYSYPKLSTINQHAKKIGSQSLKMLVDQIGHTDVKTKTVTITSSLNSRETT